MESISEARVLSNLSSSRNWAYEESQKLDSLLTQSKSLFPSDFGPFFLYLGKIEEELCNGIVLDPVTSDLLDEIEGSDEASESRY